MRLHFSKMHGLGNDFMVVDLVTQSWEPVPIQIARLADRRTGVGFDQLLAVLPPSRPDADFLYRIFNADGTEAQQCGNGVRCVAKFVSDHNLSPKRFLTIETLSGVVRTRLHDDDNIEVGMGVPTTEPGRIPFLTEGAALAYPLRVGDCEMLVTPLSMGNPHAVLFVDNVQGADVARIGAALTAHERFPEGVNVGFCQVVDPGFARLRVYERGVGETRACGTGACAAAVAGRLHGKLHERVKVSLPGGKLRIRWPGPDSELTMTGPACLVYEGQLEL
jgi:diaminopimelate epimerase